MGKSAGEAPKFSNDAERQAQSSQAAIAAQTQANRPSINTGFVNQQWGTDANGNPTLTNQLGGGLGTTVGQLQGQAAGNLGQQLNPALFGAPMTGDAARQQAITSAYDESSKRLNPMFEQRQGALEAQLANQGLAPGSAAYRTAMQGFGADRNDAYTSALANAIGQGTSAGTAVFGQNLQAQQQAIANAIQQRQLPLQELSQLQGMSNVLPGFAQAGVADPTQYLQASQAQGDYQMRQAEMQNQLLGSAIGALGGVAKGAMSFSDARLKRNIEPMGEDALPGVPLVSFEYVFEPGVRHIGVLAQDLERVRPEAVSTHESGFKVVDYAFLEGVR